MKQFLSHLEAWSFSRNQMEGNHKVSKSSVKESVKKWDERENQGVNE